MIVLFLCILLSTCVSNVKVMEAASPDGALKARVVEGNGGATTDFGYSIVLDRASFPHWEQRVAYFYAAHRSDCAYGVNIRWSDNDTLVVSYLDARSADVSGSARLFGRKVQIVSHSGVTDPHAPCGGMEYAQHDRVTVVR